MFKVKSCVFAAISELGIPKKLIRLCRLTFSNSCCFVKVGLDVCQAIDTVLGFRQDDLFHFVNDSVLRNAGVHYFFAKVFFADNIDHKSHQARC